MFGVKNKDIRTTSISSVSFVDLEQVNVCWDVTKSLLNDLWSHLKMLCIKCLPRPSNFYWQSCFDVQLIFKCLNVRKI